MYDVIYCPRCGAEMNGPEMPTRGCWCGEEEQDEKNIILLWSGPGWYASRATWDDSGRSIVVTEKFGDPEESLIEVEPRVHAARYGTPVFYSSQNESSMGPGN